MKEIECYWGISVGYGLRVDYCVGKLVGVMKGVGGE